MESMNYFGQVVIEILEKQLAEKQFWKLKNRDFGKVISLIRTSIHAYGDVLNMKLNIWLEIPSKYT